MIRYVLFDLLISLAWEKVCSAWFWNHFFALSKSACGGQVRRVRHFVQPWPPPGMSELSFWIWDYVLHVEHISCVIMNCGQHQWTIPSLFGVWSYWSHTNCYGKTWRLPCPFFRNLHLQENLANDCFTSTASTATNSVQNIVTRLRNCDK